MQHRLDLYDTLGYRPGEPWSFSRGGSGSS
jgi:hypothetical protein